MSRRLHFTPLIALGLLLTACTPAAPQARPPAAQVAPAAAAPKTLTIGLPDQPLNLATLFAGTGVSAGSSSASELFHIVSGRLAVHDEKGASYPELALALPNQQDGTWLVRSDGTMQTTYRLRPNVTWHDGTALSAGDFVLAWQMTLDPALPISQQNVARQISRIDTPDDQTLVIEWSKIYPFANAIIEDDLGPFPSHILGPVFATQKARVPEMGYWTRDFVGVGPYRITEWQEGTGLTVERYAGFYGGRPKLDKITFRILGDQNAAAAALLAGAIDGAVNGTLDLGGSLTFKQQAERNGTTPLLILQTTHWLRLGAQFRVPNPPEITDPRVRQAMLLGIDRKALADAIWEGYGTVSDTFIPPDDAKWQWIEDVLVRYPYDQTRAQQLLNDVGWRKGSDGIYLNAAGERVTIGLWTTGSNTRDVAIIGDNWKSMGVTAEQLVLSPAQNQDSQFRVSYPGFAVATFPIAFEFSALNLASGNCASEGTQFRGNNRGCFADPENDRLINALSRAIDPAEQRQNYRDLVHLQSTVLPELPLYFKLSNVEFRQGVTGVKGNSIGRGGLGWNVTEWDVQ
jgi:peptide/nickel transport system substrate-binding protein